MRLHLQERSPTFRPVMEAYFQAALALGHRTLRLLALALELEPTWFESKFQRPLVEMTPVHYTAQLSNADEVPGTLEP